MPGCAHTLGDLAPAAGDLAAARTAYQAGLAIAERLAAADPANTGWQRDLSVGHNKVGDLAVASGDLPAARTAYEAALAIRRKAILAAWVGREERNPRSCGKVLPRGDFADGAWRLDV